MQTPCLFAAGEQKLYGIFFPPVGRPNGRGIVLCNAFGKEFEICRTQISHFARHVASKGFAVFRFDYGGYGDSEGDFAEASITTMATDLDHAVLELRRRADVSKLGLLGIRFGAVVAAVAAARRTDVDNLVLWAPTMKPWDYIYEGLRQTLAMQTMIFRDIKITRDQIIENVLAGRPSMIGGYNLNCTDEGFPLGAAFVRELQELRIAELASTIGAATLALHIAKREEAAPAPLAQFVERLGARGVASRADVAVEPTLPWMHEGIFAASAPNVYAKTVEWLER